MEQTAVTGEAFGELVGWLASLSWPQDKAGLLELGRGRGWEVVSDRPGKGARFDTGLAGPRSWASITVVGDDVTDLRVTTSSVSQAGDTDGAAFHVDAFADQVRTATEVLGREPDERVPGRHHQAGWLLPSGARLRVGGNDEVCDLTLTSPFAVQVERDLERRG